MNKEEKEVQVIEKMISIYCKGNHKNKSLCDDCNDLLEYATKRIHACPRKERKLFVQHVKYNVIKKKEERK